jgi:ABC-type transport system substrate-binding protein
MKDLRRLTERINRGLPRFAAAGLAAIWLLGCPAPRGEVAVGRDNGTTDSSRQAPSDVHASPARAADFLPRVITDEFNPDVPEELRVRRVGRRGGTLRLRNPANLAHLNSLTISGAPERVVVLHLSDALVGGDPTTLEPFPELAHWYQQTDLVKPKGQPPIEGRILERTGEGIHFAPGAWRVTYCLYDHERVDGMVLTLKDTVGGGERRGTITPLDHTIIVDEGGDPDRPRQFFRYDELDVYRATVGAEEVERPFAKQNCAFEFVLREGVRWHDGQPLTAADVHFSYEAALNPHVEAQGIRPYLQDVSLCEVTRGGRGVRFHYAKPYFQALEVLGGVGMNWIMPRHVFRPERFGGDEKALGDAFNSHPFKDAPIYTGPYRFASWDRAGALAITRNEDYWKSQLPEGAVPLWHPTQPYFDRIEWILYQDSAAAVKDLQNGRIDADLDVEPTTWMQPETNSARFLRHMTRAETIGFVYTYIGWNMENPIFQDVETRRALAMLIPRDEIGIHVHGGLGFPVSGPFYSLGPGHDRTIAPIGYDPEEAIRILARNGWLDRDGDGIREKWINGRWVPFRFDYYIHNARDYHQKIADIIKEHVEEAGIDMRVVMLDWTIFSETVRDKKFDAVRFAWGQTVEPDPFQIWHSSQIANRGDNFISYRNDRIDEICLLLRETFDPIERWSLAREFHRIVAEEQPVCFLFGFRTNFFIHRDLRGVRHYPSAYPHNFSEWWWERPGTPVAEGRR